MKNTPIPRLPHSFFKWYCRADRYEEIHGDLEELFYERVEKKGPAFARLHYALDVIRSCQPYTWKMINDQSTLSQGIMLRNHLTISWRNLRKHSLFSIINISGLAVGIAACLAIVLFVLDELSYDKYNTKADRIYR